MFARNICITVFVLSVLVTGVSFSNAQDVNVTRIDSIFAEFDRPDVPGCAVAVYRDGNIEYAGGYGSANLELGVRITPSTVFDIGSLSKQFTAAAVILLYQEGKIDLDADIRTYLPQLPDYGTPISVRNLLHHTSGLRDYITLLLLAGHQMDDVTTPAEAFTILTRQKALEFDPGSKFQYSNSGYFLLSQIVERISGQSLREYAREHLFEPLGMKHTLYRDDHAELVPLRATAYARAEKGYRIDVSNWEQLGDGAVFTTVEDLLLWDQNFYNPKVGGLPFVQTQLTRGRLASGNTLDYAMGLMHGTHNGFQTVEHGGSWGGYRSEIVRVPDRKISVVTLCNGADIVTYPLVDRVLDLYLPETQKPKGSDQRPESDTVFVEPVAVITPEKKTGSFRNDEKGWTLTFEWTGDTLAVQAFGRRFELRPAGVNVFELVGGPMPATYRFEQSPVDSLVRVVQTLPYTSDVFEPFIRAVPTVEDLRAYAGTYFSPELETTYTVVVEGDGLAVNWFNGDRIELKPMERDEFARPGVRMVFERTGGAVTGLSLDAGGIHGLRFVRTEHVK